MTTICGDPGIQKLTLIIFYEYFFAKALESKVICKHKFSMTTFCGDPGIQKLFTLNKYKSQLLA